MTSDKAVLGPERDPVCGMTVEPARAAGSVEHAGRTYYFCSRSCADRFRADPGRFVQDAAAKPVVPASTTPGSAAQSYTCPMHPEVRQDKPGACPKCGMSLEPVALAPQPAAKTEYVCPMHPEIVRPAPGTCPTCGMALEPRTVTLADEENPELVDMRRRFRWGLALTIPVFVLAMSDALPGRPLHGLLSPAAQAWIEMLLAAPVVLWAGRSEDVV